MNDDITHKWLFCFSFFATTTDPINSNKLLINLLFGKIIVGDEEPYKYLTRTIKEFPSQEEFLEIIKSSDFVAVDYRNIFNGVVAMHSAEKRGL